MPPLRRIVSHILPPSLRIHIRSAITHLSIIACYVLFFIVDCLIQFIQIFIPLRVGRLYTHRIGEFAQSLDYYLRKKRTSEKNSIDVLFGVEFNSNKSLARIASGRVILVKNKILIKIFSFVEKKIRKKNYYIDNKTYNTEYKICSMIRSEFDIDKKNERCGREFLNRIGAQSQDWFVCFHNRDSEYLKSNFNLIDFSYHDHRNTKVENLFDAMQYVADKGGLALRMGSFVADPLPVLGEKIIDYANKYRSEELDIFLTSRCRFFVGNTSGISLVARLFDRPIIYTNGVPHCLLPYRPDSLGLPKLIRRKGESQPMHFAEAKEIGLFSYTNAPSRSEHYESAGVELIENDAVDIQNACADMFNYLEGNELDPDGLELSAYYIRMYANEIPGVDFAGALAPSFALRHRDLIL